MTYRLRTVKAALRHAYMIAFPKREQYTQPATVIIVHFISPPAIICNGWCGDKEAAFFRFRIVLAYLKRGDHGDLVFARLATTS